MPELIQLGITAQYRGYPMIASALALMDHVPGMLDNTMQLYERVGQTMAVPAHNVERNIRTVARRAWNQNPAYLEKLAGYALPKPPSAREFLFILYLCR